MNKSIMGGKPCIVGTRIPVETVVKLVKEYNITPKDIVSDYYTSLTETQIKTVINWYEKDKNVVRVFV